jgi:hypothetical protein
VSEPGKLACACGNTARLGETRCGRCISHDMDIELGEDFRRKVEMAAMDLDPESPIKRFADALVEYLDYRFP